MVIYVALGLSYVRHFRLFSHRIYCLSSRGHFVCLVDSFRYNSLPTVALVGFGRMRALCARCGPFGLAIALKSVGWGGSLGHRPPC